jgi:hypothetical protein
LLGEAKNLTKRNFWQIDGVSWWQFNSNFNLSSKKVMVKHYPFVIFIYFKGYLLDTYLLAFFSKQMHSCFVNTNGDNACTRCPLISDVFKVIDMAVCVSLLNKGWISKSNLCPTLEICALGPSFLRKFTLTWHHEFAPCAQLIVCSPRFGCVYTLRLTFMKSTQGELNQYIFKYT